MSPGCRGDKTTEHEPLVASHHGDEGHAAQGDLADSAALQELDSLHYFGVFDGHGGADAARHCAQRMHQVLADTVRNMLSPEVTVVVASAAAAGEAAWCGSDTASVSHDMQFDMSVHVQGATHSHMLAETASSAYYKQTLLPKPRHTGHMVASCVVSAVSPLASMPHAEHCCSHDPHRYLSNSHTSSQVKQLTHHQQPQNQPSQHQLLEAVNQQQHPLTQQQLRQQHKHPRRLMRPGAVLRGPTATEAATIGH